MKTSKEQAKKPISTMWSSNLFGSADLINGLGFSFFLAWFTFLFQHYTFYSKLDGGPFIPSVIGLGVIVVFYVTFFFLRKKRKNVSPTVAIPASISLMVLGTVLISPLPMFDSHRMVAIAFGMTFASVGAAWYAIRWGYFFLKFDNAQVMGQLVCAFAIALFFQIVFILIGDFDTNGSLFSMTLAIVFLGLSMAVLLSRTTSMRKEDTNVKRDRNVIKENDYSKHAHILRKMTFGAFGMSLLMIFNREAFITTTFFEVGPVTFSIIHAIALVLIIPSLIYILVQGRKGEVIKAINISYRVCVLAALTGICAGDVNGVVAIIAFGISTAGFIGFVFTFIYSIIQLAKEYHYSIAATFCRILAAIAGGMFISNILARGFDLSMPVGTFTLSGALAIVLTLVMISIYLFVFDANDISSIITVEKKDRGSWRQRCEAVAQQYKLSGRELEVMMLLAKGRNSAYIQETLCLSKSTVSTHRQHIYAKLDIHTQQELLNVIENVSVAALASFTPLSDHNWRD